MYIEMGKPNPQSPSGAICVSKHIIPVGQASCSTTTYHVTLNPDLIGDNFSYEFLTSTKKSLKFVPTAEINRSGSSETLAAKQPQWS